MSNAQWNSDQAEGEASLRHMKAKEEAGRKLLPALEFWSPVVRAAWELAMGVGTPEAVVNAVQSVPMEYLPKKEGR